MSLFVVVSHCIFCFASLIICISCIWWPGMLFCIFASRYIIRISSKLTSSMKFGTQFRSLKGPKQDSGHWLPLRVTSTSDLMTLLQKETRRMFSRAYSTEAANLLTINRCGRCCIWNRNGNYCSKNTYKFPFCRDFIGFTKF